jgi:hypothetical protein
MLKSDCCETTVNGAQRFAKPKERPPGRTEDEDELEDDYDYLVKRGSRDRSNIADRDPKLCFFHLLYLWFVYTNLLPAMGRPIDLTDFSASKKRRLFQDTATMVYGLASQDRSQQEGSHIG